MIIGMLLLITAILLFGRGAVLLALAGGVLWGVATFAHAETSYSYAKSPVTVVCPNPEMTALLESLPKSERFSQKWQYIGGHSHCRTIRNDRPLIITKAGSITFNGKPYAMAEMYPAGVIVTADGFSGPYYILASRLKQIPTSTQIHGNVESLLPTQAHYSTEGVDAAPSH